MMLLVSLMLTRCITMSWDNLQELISIMIMAAILRWWVIFVLHTMKIDYSDFYRNDNGELEMDCEYEYEYEDGIDRAFIDGWCKWSVQSAMVDNAISMRETPERWSGEGQC